MRNKFKSLVLFCLIFVFTGGAIADLPAITPRTTDGKCPSSGVLGAGLIDKICWDCIFPIIMFQIPFGGGQRPDAANTNLMCSCELGSTGVNAPGISAGYRAMARVMEVVRDPHCSPFLGGVKLFGESLMKTSPRKAKNATGSDKIYLNTNSWSFPLLYMIEALVDKNCNGDATAVNLIGLSTLSPTWANDELSFHLNPEAAVFANPLFLVSAIADGAMITASPDTWGNSQTRDTWMWSIGSWGSSLYPLTGNVPHSSSPPRETALVAAKSLALSHRIGQSRLTMGSSNMCGGNIYPMMPKTQYKISQLYPMAQASSRPEAIQLPAGTMACGVPPMAPCVEPTTPTGPCCRQLGESTLKWSEWRNIPGFEDYIYLIYRWTDCCILLM